MILLASYTKVSIHEKKRIYLNSIKSLTKIILWPIFNWSALSRSSCFSIKFLGKIRLTLRFDDLHANGYIFVGPYQVE